MTSPKKAKKDRPNSNVGLNGDSYHKRYYERQQALGRSRCSAYVDREVAAALADMAGKGYGAKQVVTEAALQIGARALALIREICPRIETGDMTAASVERLLRETLTAATRNKPAADLATVAAEIGPLVEAGIEMRELKTLQQLMKIREDKEARVAA